MSIIHEALKKASRKRGGLYRLIEHEPFREHIHIERPDKVKRYAVIIIIALGALNVSIFAWNFSLKSEMRRIALAAMPESSPVERVERAVKLPAARRPAVRAAVPAGPGEEAVRELASREEDLPPQKEEPLPELVLKGIMRSQTRSRAFINERMVKEGDEIEGAEVVSIKDQSVLLRMGDREFEIR